MNEQSLWRDIDFAAKCFAFRLNCEKYGLKFTFLLVFRRLLIFTVVVESQQLILHFAQTVGEVAVGKPADCALNPDKKVGRNMPRSMG